jgi:hypothetical protein
MQKSPVATLFEHAGEIDNSLAIEKRYIAKLEKNQIVSSPYNQSILFENMASGKASIFHNFQSPYSNNFSSHDKRIQSLLKSIKKSGIDYQVRTRAGKAHHWQYYSVAELVEKWQRNRARINVTDLHLRKTGIETSLDTRALSQFNLLPISSDTVSWIEMMTFVISTSGGFSDSHSDDCDGSNHCFTGKKLWLAWDTNEGLYAGLEDLDRQKVEGRCNFDMGTFLSQKSACWFTIESGETLFMPGHYSHKVITLEPYLGVGSFYLAYPNLLRTLSRWLVQKPNWENLNRKGYRDQVYPEIAKVFRNKSRALSKTGKLNQAKWGLGYFEHANVLWNKNSTSEEKDALHELKLFDQFLTR